VLAELPEAKTLDGLALLPQLKADLNRD